MHLAELRVRNFRKLKDVTLEFQPGLNILVGPNNTGKTAVVDALRALLGGLDEPYPRMTTEDVHRPKAGTAEGDILFEYVFANLDLDDESEFMPAIRPGPDGAMRAHFSVSYGSADKTGRLQAKRWCGEHKENGLTTEMADHLRGVYLPALRDASTGLSRKSSATPARPTSASAPRRPCGRSKTQNQNGNLSNPLEELDKNQDKSLKNKESFRCRPHLRAAHRPVEFKGSAQFANLTPQPKSGAIRPLTT